MTCFCSAQMKPLATLMPRVSLSVGAVPPQMPQLVALLGLTAGAPTAERLDLKMSAMLSGFHGQAWVPLQVPPLMKMSAQLSSLAGFLPLHDLNALMAALQQMLNSLTAHLTPVLAGAARLPRMPMANMVLAARMTLSLRAKGLCPMALAGLDSSFAMRDGLGNATQTLRASVSASATLRGQPFPRFGLPLPQLSLALSLAGLAPLASMPPALGLPPVGSSAFAPALMALLSQLASLPALPLDISKLLSELARLSDLMAIQQAFGMDAMSATGVARVQAMLNFIGRLGLPPLPDLALALQPKLDMLPTMDAVHTGAQVAQLNVSTFNTAMSLTPPRLPILSALTALNALKAMLADFLGLSPMNGCVACPVAA